MARKNRLIQFRADPETARALEELIVLEQREQSDLLRWLIRERRAQHAQPRPVSMPAPDGDGALGFD
jgi:hypothetical protein